MYVDRKIVSDFCTHITICYYMIYQIIYFFVYDIRT